MYGETVSQNFRFYLYNNYVKVRGKVIVYFKSGIYVQSIYYYIDLCNIFFTNKDLSLLVLLCLHLYYNNQPKDYVFEYLALTIQVEFYEHISVSQHLHRMYPKMIKQ